MGHRPIHHRVAAGAIGRRALLLASLAGGVGRRAAAQDDAWTVRGVAVDVAGPDAVAARERALADGTRQAWEQLLARITTPDRAAPLRALTGSEIEALTESVEILDERVAPGRYRATLAVIFSPDRVRMRLAGSGGGAGGGGGPIQAQASFRGLSQWADLMRRLEASPAVARVELLALRAGSADLRLLLTAEPGEAGAMLSAAGIVLQPDPGGLWRLQLAAR